MFPALPLVPNEPELSQMLASGSCAKVRGESQSPPTAVDCFLKAAESDTKAFVEAPWCDMQCHISQ